MVENENTDRAREKMIEAANSNAMYQLLVADDEREICMRIKRELDKEGYRVAAAYNGEQCLEYFKNNRVDMLITTVKKGIEQLNIRRGSSASDAGYRRMIE